MALNTWSQTKTSLYYDWSEDMQASRCRVPSTFRRYFCASLPAHPRFDGVLRYDGMKLLVRLGDRYFGAWTPKRQTCVVRRVQQSRHSQSHLHRLASKNHSYTGIVQHLILRYQGQGLVSIYWMVSDVRSTFSACFVASSQHEHFDASDCGPLVPTAR